MRQMVSWVREHRNGYCSIEEFPLTSISREDEAVLRQVAEDGGVDVLPNGEKLHNISFWTEEDA